MSSAAVDRTRTTRSRMADARTRIRRSKTALVVGGLATFLVALPLARLTYAGHPKHRSRALDAPASFRRSVSHDLLAAGILAPAQAPSDAVTSTS